MIKAYELLESSTWTVEKVTASNDSIYTTTKSIGKVYKLRGQVNYPARKLLHELYYNIENVPSWNPTLLESKIIKVRVTEFNSSNVSTPFPLQKIDSNTDISYSVSASGGRGIVKSRDFVNLRCWRLMNDSRIIEHNIHSPLQVNHQKHDKECLSEGDEKLAKTVNETLPRKSASTNGINNSHTNASSSIEDRLSKSLGATNISSAIADEEDEESDEGDSTESEGNLDHLKDVFVSAAISIDYEHCPPTSKFIRGNNTISCWAMRPVAGDDASCIFEWVLCIDLKGSLPKYVLNTVS